MTRLPFLALVSALSWGVVSLSASLSACNNGEPPPLDAGTDASSDASDAATGLDGAHDTSTGKDVTVHDSGHADAGEDHRTTSDAPHEAAHADAETGTGVDAGLCGNTGAACTGDTVCYSGACAPTGQPGERCGTGEACTSGTLCNANGFCELCGGAGQACCAADECASGGCCVAGVCTPSGSICPFTGGGLCANSNCGNACTDGGCAVCGGAGQNCCGSVGCTAPAVQCETTVAGSGSGSAGAKVCKACGGAGEACCGSTCLGGSLTCTTSSDGLCVECGGAGELCCTASDAGACNGTLACTASRCLPAASP